MYQFFVDSSQVTEQEAIIIGNDVNHIKNVLRMKPGEEIQVNDGEHTWLCEVKELHAEQVTAFIKEQVENSELPVKICLFQGLPKADKLENIIQKSVELGAYEIVPVAMKRCVVKLDEKKQDAKRKRWQAIAESAAKQAKRSLIPDVRSVMNYKEALAYAGDMDILLLPYEHAEGMKRTREVLYGIKPGSSIGILIGPEGGFDEDEVELAMQRGAEVITLGKRILRTETAGPAVLAMLGLCLEQD